MSNFSDKELVEQVLKIRGNVQKILADGPYSINQDQINTLSIACVLLDIGRTLEMIEMHLRDR